MLAGVFNKGISGGDSKMPEHSVRDAANILLQGFRRSQPAVLSAGLRPKIIGWGRVPAWHVYSIGHMSDGHLVCWPLRKKRLKEMPADFSVQAAHTIDRPTAPDCQIGHVETLRRVVAILAAQSQQIVE